MSKLLELPNELITEIIDLVLRSSSISIPPNTKRHRNFPSPCTMTGCFIQSKEAYRPNALDILLACHKLHNMTMDYLLRTSPTWRLDISIVNDHWFFPTWRYIAPRASVIGGVEQLEINIVPCFTEDEREKTTTWLKDEPPNSFAGRRSFWSFLTYVVALRNVDGGKTSSPREASPNFRDWTINVPDPHYGSGNDVLSYNDVPVRSIDGLAHLDFDPLYPIDSATSSRLLDKINAEVGEFKHYHQRKNCIQIERSAQETERTTTL
jgi:hypothetical protein